jgi:uncharacterized phage protein (TIGR02216 family)
LQNFPWQDAARIGFGLLRLSPREFWQLTPKELVMIFDAFGIGASQGLDRQTFQQMADKFPDEEKFE